MGNGNIEAAVLEHTEKAFAAVQVSPEDSRQTFVTGAVRDTGAGKGRFDLIPPYPLRRLAIHYENGARKYADRNWERGLPLSRFIDSAERHLNRYKDGDRTEDHLAAVLWNVMGYLHTEREVGAGRLPESLRDVPWPSSL